MFEKRPLRSPVLLLVEDDETDALFVRRCHLKQSRDTPLVIARDGEEALAILRGDGRGERPYVVVTDLNMPGMSGHELIEQIRADQVLRKTVVFVLSSSSLAGDIERAYEHNVAGYLSKKAPSDVLTRHIGMIFDYCSAVQLPA